MIITDFKNVCYFYLQLYHVFFWHLLATFMAITVDYSIVLLPPSFEQLGCFTFFSHAGQCCEE